MMKTGWIVITLAVLVSGCLSTAGGVPAGNHSDAPAATAAFCSDLADQLESEERACSCEPIGDIESLNRSDDVDGVCRCSCEQNGETVTIDIGRSRPLNESNSTG